MQGNETDLKTLSKRRYVMRARLDSTGKLHQERLRIAYANKDLVYVIVHGSDKLVGHPLWTILPDLPVALVMEKFRTGDKGSFVLYWNPVPRERIDVLETSFRSMALDAMLSITGRELHSQLQRLQDVTKAVTVLETKQARLKDEQKRESARWTDVLTEQADMINHMIAMGRTVSSTFVHPGTDMCGQGERLKILNDHTADVLSVVPPRTCGSDGCHLDCHIRFTDRPGSPEFHVPDYTLIDLYRYLIEAPADANRNAHGGDAEC